MAGKKGAGKPRIAAAVGTAVGSGATGEKSDLARRLEAASVEAVEQAMADGISLDDSDEILARKQAAREKVLAEVRTAG